MLQKSLGKREVIEEDRPLQKDDVAVIDYEAFKDGVPFADIQKAEKYPMTLGTGQITPEFDDQIIGMNPGDDREVVISFPDDSTNTQLAGQEISFQVTLNTIEKTVLPEIDDQLARNAGEYESLDELKAKINENLKRGNDRRVDQELDEQIFNTLISKVEFELPDASVAYELESIIAEAERSFRYQNMSFEDMGISREMLEQQYREPAEKQARRHLILDKIIDQEALALSDEELDDGYSKMAETVNQTVEEIKTFHRDREEQAEFFRHGLLEKKAIKLIIENGRISEVEPEKEPETEEAPEK
ncbi:MAG: trigger factor, partial [Desulfobacterales bacterium]